MPDNASLQRQQDEYNRKVKPQEILDFVDEWMKKNRTEDETQDEEPPQVESKIPMPPDEELTEEHWEGIYGPEVAKAMVEMGLITPRKNSTKSTD